MKPNYPRALASSVLGESLLWRKLFWHVFMCATFTLKCFPKRLGNKSWDCHYREELENRRTVGGFGVLGAVTLRFLPPKVKSNHIFVHLSSCIMNYKKLRKKPSHILRKISLKLISVHWLSAFLAIWERKESGRAIFIKFIIQNYLGPCS